MRGVVKKAPTKPANYVNFAKIVIIIDNLKGSERGGQVYIGPNKICEFCEICKFHKNCLKVVREVIKKVPTKSANSAKYVRFINKLYKKWSKGPPHKICKFCENRKTLQNSSPQKKQWESGQDGSNNNCPVHFS